MVRLRELVCMDMLTGQPQFPKTREIAAAVRIGAPKGSEHCPQSSSEAGSHLVSEKEHDGARVVQLVHSIEVRNLTDVNQINHREVLYLVCTGSKDLRHTVREYQSSCSEQQRARSLP